MSQVTKKYALLWYDGPHLEIQGVRDSAEDKNEIVEVSTWAAEVQDLMQGTYVTVRLSREDLQTMLALIDSLPIDDALDHDPPAPAVWEGR